MSDIRNSENDAAGCDFLSNNPAARDGRENIKVLVRIRPLLGKESGPVAKVVGTEGKEILVTGATANKRLRCRYDAVIGPEVSQEQMASHVRECTTAVLDGENSTIFAYGQTGSGKTYTMFGPETTTHHPGFGKGVIPQAVDDIFKGLVRARSRCTLKLKYIAKRLHFGSTVLFLIYKQILPPSKAFPCPFYTSSLIIVM